MILGNEQLFMFDAPIDDLVAKILNYPVHFFANTMGGEVLAVNDMQAEYFGASSVSAFLGKSYFEMISKTEMEAITSNNIITISNNAPQLFHETGLGKECLSIKTRLLNARNHTIGVGGIAFYLHQIPLKDIVVLMNKLVYLQPVANMVQGNYVSNTNRLSKLSDRERECVYFLSRGMTYKEIASVLGISSRTVEVHIENIKNKLECYSRSDIVSMAFELKTPVTI